MSFFKKIGGALKSTIAKIGTPLAVGALAIPGIGPVVSAGIGAIGQIAGGIKASAEGVSKTTTNIGGGLAKSAAAGYVTAAQDTVVNPVTGTTLAQTQLRSAVGWAVVVAGLLVIPSLLRPKRGGRRY